MVEVVDITDDSEVRTSFKLELEGVPNAQARPRIGKYGFYNPNSRAKKTFKATVKSGISNVIFEEGPVSVKIKFYMRRPDTHFKGNNRLKHSKRSFLSLMLVPRTSTTWPSSYSME